MWLCCSRSTFSLFALCSVFFLSVCSEWTGRLLLTAWIWPVKLSSPCAKAGHYMFGHLGCQFISTVMPFELLLYHKLIFAFFGFAVCSSCQNRSLFLCIVSSVNVTKDNRYTQDSAKNILNLLQQFSVHSGEGKGGLSFPFAPLLD